MREDQLAEVFDSRRGQPDLRHLQLFEPDRLATTGLLTPELHPLPRTGNAVQYGPNVRRLALQLRQRLREERHCEIVLLRVRTLGQRRQAPCEVHTLRLVGRDWVMPLSEAFAVDSSRGADLYSHASYLRLFGTHFVDADSYNAAKHGMTLRGGRRRLELEIDGWRLLDRDGVTVDWLARWPRDDPEQAPRWTQVSRFSTQTPRLP